MTAVRTTPAYAPTNAPTRLRRVSAEIGKRLMLDRQVEFWLGEIRPAWSLEELRARVVEVIDETHDVKTFVLAAPGRAWPGAQAWPGHRAGHYVPVDVEIAGKRVRRCYSISSPPGAKRIAVTVKRVPGGVVSTWMHERVQPGDVLTLGAPAGNFVLPERTPGKLLLLSGGSGVTPVMSILRDLAARDELRDVVFVHAARSRADVIFARELERLASRHPGLRLAFRFDDDPRHGRLDESSLRALVPDLAERETYLCGPEGMMSALARTWTDAGIAHRLHCERFVALRAAPRAPSATAKVRLTVAERTVVADGKGSLLEQLERSGEKPAYGCRMGICNTCRCRKRSGVVEDLVTGAISDGPDEDIRLCSSVACSDLELAL
jgi:ferredoxin-NADP reductase